MSETIPDDLISQFSEFINAKTGLYFPKERWQELRRIITAIAKDFAKKYSIDNDAITCLQWLLSSPLTENHIDMLVKHLTIGETYFFRDKNLFQILENDILPELIRFHRKKNKILRFWSAACCTGEEPYSLAILIDQILPEWKDWQITIVATDINTSFLEKAKKGIYRKWSFRNTPEQIIEKYFKKHGENSFKISPHLKNMITYSQLNLANNHYPSILTNTHAMDIIICRNVLMYFAPKLRKEIVDRFTRSLSKNGWMIFNPGDAPYTQHSALIPVRFPNIILYRKKSSPIHNSCICFQKSLQLSIPNQRQPIMAKALQNSMTPKSSDWKFPEFRKSETAGKQTTVSEQTDWKFNKFCKSQSNMVQTAVSAAMSEVSESSDCSDDTNQNLYQKAIALANQGQLDKAEKYCKQVINAEKLHPEYHYLLATIYQEKGCPKESLKSLRHALYLDPKFVMAHFLLGNLMQQEGRHTESKKYLGNALSLLLSLSPDEILPYSEGMTVGRLTEIVQSMLNL